MNNTFLLPTSQLIGTGPYLKRSEYAALLTRVELLNRTDAEARSRHESAQTAAQQAAEQGYQEGLRRAHEETAAQRMQTLFEADQFLQNIERQLVEIVVQTIERILGQWDCTDLTTQMIAKALSELRTNHQILVWCAPSKAPDLTDRIQQSGQAMSMIRVKNDTSLSLQECRIETDQGDILLNIETLIGRIHHSALASLQSKESDNDATTGESSI